MELRDQLQASGSFLLWKLEDAERIIAGHIIVNGYTAHAEMQHRIIIGVETVNCKIAPKINTEFMTSKFFGSRRSPFCLSAGPYKCLSTGPYKSLIIWGRASRLDDRTQRPMLSHMVSDDLNIILDNNNSWFAMRTYPKVSRTLDKKNSESHFLHAALRRSIPHIEEIGIKFDKECWILSSALTLIWFFRWISPLIVWALFFCRLVSGVLLQPGCWWIYFFPAFFTFSYKRRIFPRPLSFSSRNISNFRARHKTCRGV